MGTLDKKLARIYIEISNVCNLKCDFCPEVHRDKKIMSFELFQSLLDQSVGQTEEVALHLMGEPLAHPRLEQFLDACRGRSVPVNFTTNGTLLKNEGRARLLLHPAIRQVNFSLQSFTSNFPSKDVGPYLAEIFDFVKVARLERSDMYVNFRLWNLNSAQSSFEENELFLGPIFREYGVVDMEGLDLRERKSYRLVDRVYLHFDSRFRWPSLADSEISPKGFCHALDTHIGIHADGTVVPCCLDKEAVLSLGNASQPGGLEQALKSQRAVRMTEGFRRGDLIEDLCRRCDYIRRFAGKRRV